MATKKMCELPGQRNWGWLLGLGIVFILLGCVGLSMAVGITVVSMLFLGVLLIIAGASQLIDTLRCRGWRGVLWHALIGVLYIAGGITVIYNPLLASTIITGLLAWMLIAIGIMRLIMAFALRDTSGWGWLLISALSALVLGILILVQWPYSGLWILGLFIAIELIINGWTYVFMAMAMRQKIR